MDECLKFAIPNSDSDYLIDYLQNVKYKYALELRLNFRLFR